MFVHMPICRLKNWKWLFSMQIRLDRDSKFPIGYPSIAIVIVVTISYYHYCYCCHHDYSIYFGWNRRMSLLFEILFIFCAVSYHTTTEIEHKWKHVIKQIELFHVSSLKLSFLWKYVSSSIEMHQYFAPHSAGRVFPRPRHDPAYARVCDEAERDGLVTSKIPLYSDDKRIDICLFLNLLRRNRLTQWRVKGTVLHNDA